MKTACSILLVLVLGGLLAGCGCGQEGAAPASVGQAAGPVAGDLVVWAPSNQPVAILTVNESPYAVVGAGGPVFVGCRISNPRSDAELPLASGKDVVPRLAGGPDHASPTWEFLTEDPGVLPPRTGVGLLWRLTSPLPPGEYRVEMDLAALVRTNLAIHGRPALLTVATNACDPRLAARTERRLLRLLGRTNEYLQAVRAARAAAPDDRALRKEEIDALECAGQNEEALQKLFELGDEMTARMPTNEVAAPPDWLVFRMEMLQNKIGLQTTGSPTPAISP